MELYTVWYYKRINSRWLRGQVRNLTTSEALQYSHMLRDLFDTNFVLITRNGEEW